MPGPFYFAWVADGSTAFSATTHAVEDISVYSITITQDEGDFASLKLQVRNPRVGLLAPGRNVWAWLSWYDGSSIVPVFYGRLVGVPSDVFGSVVELEFIARPEDYATQQSTLADSLKVDPYWDPAWISSDQWDVPDTVLEARTALWHVDRLTHVVTVSDVLNGEDGTIIFQPGDTFTDELKVSYGQAPVRRVEVTATANWVQHVQGIIDATPGLSSLFGSTLAGAAYNPSLPVAIVQSFSGDGLSGDWPKSGDDFGGGWSVYSTSLTRADGLQWDTVYQIHDFVAPTRDDAGVITAWTKYSAWYPLWEFTANLDLLYSADRQRYEILTFTLEADVQSVVTEPGDDEVVTLTPNSNVLSQDVDGETPIGDVRRRAYFPLDRGQRSINYLVMLARANLLIRARCVDVTAMTSWAKGIGAGISLRKNAQVQDPNIAGGSATGKITTYTLTYDGDSGGGTCQFTIGCTAGRGNTVTARTGTPEYVADGYVNDGWELFQDQDVMPLAGQVTWSLPTVTPADDGIDFFNFRWQDPSYPSTTPQANEHVWLTGGPDPQRAAIQALPFTDTDEAYTKVLSQVYTVIHMQMRPVTGGPFTTNYALTVSDVMVPKTIDLEYSGS